MHMYENETIVEVRHFRRHQHLTRDGQTPSAVYRLEEGWTCSYQLFGGGRRQITMLFLPGDYCEPQWLLGERRAHAVIALTSVRARSLPLAECAANGSQGSNMRAILSATLAMLSRQSEWIATLGRKTATERICALLGDIFERLRANGRAFNNTCPLPLTQTDMADVVGLTPIHVNRVLKDLRKRGLLDLQSRRLYLSDPVALREIGSGYAHA